MRYQSCDLEKNVIYRSGKRKRQSIPQNTRKLTNLPDFSSWRKSKSTSCFPEWIWDKIKDIFSITLHLFYIGLRILVYIHDEKRKDLLVWTYSVHTYQSLKHSLKHSYFRINSRYLGYDRKTLR